MMAFFILFTPGVLSDLRSVDPWLRHHCIEPYLCFSYPVAVVARQCRLLLAKTVR